MLMQQRERAYLPFFCATLMALYARTAEKGKKEGREKMSKQTSNACVCVCHFLKVALYRNTLISASKHHNKSQ